MHKNLVVAVLALASLAACAASPQASKIATRNGEDYYKLDVSGPAGQPSPRQVTFWSEKTCPQGYRVVSAKPDPITPGITAGNFWWNVTIACPAR